VQLPELRIREAEPADAEAILALLSEARLPLAGIPGDAALLVVACSGRQVVGVAGLELHGGDGLLRSVAVAPAFRGIGLAAKLCCEIESRAGNLGARRMYLLTETAEKFFVRRGYRELDRLEAPPAIAASAEFAAVCPASAALMLSVLSD
jgi:amino-acid N-acetyltransferase